MKPRGSYKLLGGRKSQLDRCESAADSRLPHALLGAAMRTQRIVDSLRCEIANRDEGHELRVRQVFSTPQEIYRLEYEVPAMKYMRTTLLDRDSLEELLEDDEIRGLLSASLDAAEDLAG